jgi:hypothetical protein
LQGIVLPIISPGGGKIAGRTATPGLFLRRRLIGRHKLRNMPEHLLHWRRTDLPSRPRDDYTGSDPAHSRLYAHVYLSTGAVSARPWYWVLAETGTIASGYEATVEAAVGAAERAYARWLADQ